MPCVQNPMWQQAMQQLLSNPDMLRSSVDAAASVNPQIRQMLDRDPSMRYTSLFTCCSRVCLPSETDIDRGEVLSCGLRQGRAAAGRTS